MAKPTVNLAFRSGTVIKLIVPRSQPMRFSCPW